MNDLATLLARWAEAHPDEFQHSPDDPLLGFVWTAKDEYGDADSNLWMGSDGPDAWANIIGGVIYHAARRGLSVQSGLDHSHIALPIATSGTYASVVDPSEMRLGEAMQFGRYPSNDGTAALRATACGLLSAYLAATAEAQP